MKAQRWGWVVVAVLGIGGLILHLASGGGMPPFVNSDEARKIERLEARVAELESSLERASRRLESYGVVQGSMLTNWGGVLSNLIADASSASIAVVRLDASLARAHEDLPELVRSELQAELGRRARLAAPAPAAGNRAAEPLREGIPVAIYNQIAANSAKLFPTSFDLQAINIKTEIEAWKRLHPK